MNLSWSMNNEKLRKLKTVSFGLPALRSEDGFTTCPGAAACSRFCFARQGWYVLPRVAWPRERNLAQARLCDAGDSELFVRRVVEDLRGMPRYRVVRVHDSGDFFSQAYLDAWYRVADHFCQAEDRRTFYAYTKSLHLDLWSEQPRNFVVVQSEGGKYDHMRREDKPQARVFPTLEALAASAYVDGHEDDGPAIEGELLVGLVYHGNKTHVRVTPELAGRIR